MKKIKNTYELLFYDYLIAKYNRYSHRQLLILQLIITYLTHNIITYNNYLRGRYKTICYLHLTSAYIENVCSADHV